MTIRLSGSIRSVGSRSDALDRTERERVPRVRFPAGLRRRGVQMGDLRRASGDSWTTTWLRRASGCHGDLVRLIDVLDCVQTKEREAAGDRRRGGMLRVWTSASICDDSDQAKRSGGCAKARQRG
jgi:hypothetical protein